MSGLIRECPDCGLFNNMTATPAAGTDICCVRCDCLLRRVRHNPLNHALACALTGLAFYIVAVNTPFLRVVLYGRFRLSTLTTGPLMLDNDGSWTVASVVFHVTVLLPLVKLLGIIYVLIRLRLPHPPRWLAFFYGWLKNIYPWVMVEVYLLGFMVAYTRLEAIMYVQMGMGAYALVGLMLALAATDVALDPEAVWEEMHRLGIIKIRVPQGSRHRLIGCQNCHQVSDMREGGECPRCGEVVLERKAHSMSRSWALMITAVFLYIPSNILPIMTVVRFGKAQSYTIFGGIRELASIGLWPLAALVFVASIAIPLFKLAVLSYMLTQTHRGASHELRLRTRLYRLIDFIGRWSMVDVFMVSILVALVRFGSLAQIDANMGVVFFASVVVLTMLAVECFDPRLMWDRATPDKNGNDGQKQGAA